MQACCICRAHTPAIDGNLVDGSVFHRRCYDQLKDTFRRLSQTETMLLVAQRKPPTLGERLALLLSQTRRDKVLEQKQLLVARLEQTRAQMRAIDSTLLQIHDVWSGYPPDWDRRRALVHNRDNSCCAECGVGNTLQLHHKRAIREGGTHRLDNLVLLCAVCHSEAHGGKELKYKGPHSVDDNSLNAVERKMAVINKAIAERRDVHFRYKKRDGTVTSRTVTPRELRKLTIPELRSLIGYHVKLEREGRLCLFGFCHLRQAKRTFAIDRMYRLDLQ